MQPYYFLQYNKYLQFCNNIIPHQSQHRTFFLRIKHLLLAYLFLENFLFDSAMKDYDAEDLYIINKPNFMLIFTTHCRKQHHLEQHHITIKILLTNHYEKQRSILYFFSLWGTDNRYAFQHLRNNTVVNSNWSSCINQNSRYKQLPLRRLNRVRFLLFQLFIFNPP